jgi:hypothetical protein
LLTPTSQTQPAENIRTVARLFSKQFCIFDL